MMNQRYLVALDQGTTSSRAVLFTMEGQIIASSAYEFKQYYPQPGWVEHDPADILSTQIEALRSVLRQTGISPAEIAAIGMTNQRETTILWDRQTGQPVYHAIVWQCRRTAPMVEQIEKDGASGMIREKTGLKPDAYFSATKIRWILDECGLQEKAENGDLCFGTVDSYLCWHMIQGHPHVTDATNASRTMLFNIRTQEWDEELLKLFRIPRALLPQVIDSAQYIGNLNPDILGTPIPVTAIAGDQHAALFGQACFEKGMVKNTYGTGCFMLMNIGNECQLSQHGLITTTAWRLNGVPTYALEGSVFIGGAAIQWLRDEMKLVQKAADSEGIAKDIDGNSGVYLVPAFTGLGAPYWDMYARGILVGLTRGTGAHHTVRAALESIAYQSADLLTAMASDYGSAPSALRVDGGASANRFLMQFQADIMNLQVQRPAVLETTALGAALLAGLGARLFSTLQETAAGWHIQDTFSPVMPEKERARLLRGWNRAIRTAEFWSSLAKEEEQEI